MCIGIALYNTDNLSAQEAYTLAQLFFQVVGLPVTDAAYRSDHAGYSNVTVSDLAQLIASGEVQDFRLYHKDGNSLPWAASFGHVTDQYGGFYHIDMQYAADIPKDKLQEFIKASAEIVNAAYGIVYVQDNVVDAYEYVLDEGVVPMPVYEKHFVWRDETPGLFNGPARYKDNMLRMVYPHNVLNHNHLNINIQGQSLGNLIVSNPALGELMPVNEGQSFIWSVPEENLTEINTLFGQAGALIAWKSQ
ncbi:hypothetical protein MTZ49_06415 [Entomomonas sp. E2T0]|uniref:hypothetical protein n=1 Tax=Entomomonas sp. E2T0 TaxID=2930213 RepID=UPI00222844BD|nr:hypothetical protein [Entomomonas sp. E2T0]UYZ85182.1 hypothetical protein MTZ49_06415 [Entomomonas sp. E2T0]